MDMSIEIAEKFKPQARHFDLLNNSVDLSLPNVNTFANTLYSHIGNGNGDTVVLIVGDSRDILDAVGPKRVRSAKYYTVQLLLICSAFTISLARAFQEKIEHHQNVVHLNAEKYRDIDAKLALSWTGSCLPFDSGREPNYSTEPSIVGAAFSLTLEVDVPGSKIVIINIPDFDWWRKEHQSPNTTALSPKTTSLSPFFSLKDERIHRAFVIGIVGHDATCPWRINTSSEFFSLLSTWDWAKTKLWATKPQTSVSSGRGRQEDGMSTASDHTKSKPDHIRAYSPSDDHKSHVAEQNSTLRTPSLSLPSSHSLASPGTCGPKGEDRQTFNDPDHDASNGLAQEAVFDDDASDGCDEEAVAYIGLLENGS